MAKTRFHSVLVERIDEEMTKRLASLASGGAIDYAAYRENVGFIGGLQAAIKLCEDIETEFDK